MSRDVHDAMMLMTKVLLRPLICIEKYLMQGIGFQTTVQHNVCEWLSGGTKRSTRRHFASTASRVFVVC